MINSQKPLLDVKNLRKYFPVRSGPLRRVSAHVKAVDDVSFDVKQGEILGLVGESGCGKSTIARVLIRLIDPDAGEIHFKTWTWLKRLDGKRRRCAGECKSYSRIRGPLLTRA